MVNLTVILDDKGRQFCANKSLLITFIKCSAFNLGPFGIFMECSWGVQPVLGVFAILETTVFEKRYLALY